MEDVNSRNYKGLKKVGSNGRNRLKFGKISGEDLLCTKMVESVYREFDHRGTLCM